jgi:hypothetical protein
VAQDVGTIEPRPLNEMREAVPAASRPERRYRSPHTMFPHTQFLSNGNYVTSVTNAGGGASVWRGAWLDDALVDAAAIPIVDDGRTHNVRVVLSRATRTESAPQVAALSFGQRGAGP